MPEMSTKYVPAHMHDENPNPKLLKFVRRVTDRIPGKIKGIKTEDPKYWGYACIFEDEFPKDESEACLDLLLHQLIGGVMHRSQMKTRQKYPYATMLEMAAKANMGDKADDLIQKLAVIGMLEYDYGDKYTKDGPIPGTTYNKEDRNYWVPLFVPLILY